MLNHSQRTGMQRLATLPRTADEDAAVVTGRGLQCRRSARPGWSRPSWHASLRSELAASRRPVHGGAFHLGMLGRGVGQGRTGGRQRRKLTHSPALETATSAFPSPSLALPFSFYRSKSNLPALFSRHLTFPLPKALHALQESPRPGRQSPVGQTLCWSFSGGRRQHGIRSGASRAVRVPNRKQWRRPGC